MKRHALILVLAVRIVWTQEIDVTKTTIVIAPDAIPSEKYAAEELQSHIKSITGVTIPISTEAGGSSIILKGNDGKFGKDGFSIRTNGQSVVITADRPRGALYAVYYLLEEQFGCRWFTKDEAFIPKKESLKLGKLDFAYNPAFEYREDFYSEAFDGTWAARQRQNGNHMQLDEKRGGKYVYFPFVHSFYSIIPPATYFKKHPEYFSEIDGTRRGDGAQLCLTNPDVLRLTIECVRGWIKDRSEATIFSVSQNDCAGACQCKACREIDEREGSPSGAILTFVNKVAEAIEKEYPDKLIDTLAYWYSRKPPKNVKPRKNVRVRLCSIECCFSHPLDECPLNKGFVEDMKGWSTITNQLYVWDYVTDFAHYLLPFPNFDSLQANIKFFRKFGVVGVFEEGNYSHGGGGELSELRSYMLAKLLWNPDTDAHALVKEFTDAVYGQAAPHIRDYLELLQLQVRGKDVHAKIFDAPDAAFLKGDFLERGEALFDKAAEAVKDKPEFLQRVRKARLCIDYLRLMRTPRNSAAFKTKAETFVKTCREFGITNPSEWQSLDDFEKSLQK